MKRLWNQNLHILKVLVLCWLLFDIASHLAGEILWFSEVGYLEEFSWLLFTQLGLWVTIFLTSVGFLFSNIAIASRFQYPRQLQVRRTELQGRQVFYSLDEFFHT